MSDRYISSSGGRGEGLVRGEVREAAGSHSTDGACGTFGHVVALFV